MAEVVATAEDGGAGEPCCLGHDGHAATANGHSFRGSPEATQALREQRGQTVKAFPHPAQHVLSVSMFHALKLCKEQARVRQKAPRLLILNACQSSCMVMARSCATAATPLGNRLGSNRSRAICAQVAGHQPP